jgi:hypothetical protein
MQACVIVAFWRRNYCLGQSFSCIDGGEAREWRCASKHDIWPREISETICVSVETPRTSSARYPSKQKIRKPWTWIPEHWFSWEAVSWFVILGPEHSWYLISKGAQAGSYVDFHPSPPLSSPPTQLTLPLLLCSMTKICIGTLPCIGERSDTLFPLWKLSVWWNGGVCRRQERSHFKPWGCSCQTSLVYKIVRVLSLPSFFQGLRIHKFCKSDLEIWALKVTGRMLGIRTSMAHYEPRLGKLHLSWSLTELLLERNSQRHLQPNPRRSIHEWLLLGYEITSHCESSVDGLIINQGYCCTNPWMQLGFQPSYTVHAPVDSFTNLHLNSL